MTILDIGFKSFGDFGPLVTLIALLVICLILKANHNWKQRSFALQIGANWNKQTKPFIDEIEIIKPGIIKFGDDQKLTQITKEEAKQIYDRTFTKDSKEWKLRTRFIHLLNEFEYIASAYVNAVGDRKIIEESFKDIFVKWGFVLENFIQIYKEERNNEYPWGPFHQLYAKWAKESPEAYERIDA